MTKTYAPILSAQEASLLLECLNMGVASVSAQLGQRGVDAVNEGTAKLAPLKALADKIRASEREAVAEAEEAA